MKRCITYDELELLGWEKLGDRFYKTKIRSSDSYEYKIHPGDPLFVSWKRGDNWEPRYIGINLSVEEFETLEVWLGCSDKC